MIDRKIKITESQYKRLFTEADEPKTTFEDLVDGDSIYITDASGSHSYQVTNDLGNAVKLTSLDVKSTKTGWDYVLSKLEDFSDGDIKLLQTSKKNPDKTRSYSIKGVTDVKTFDRTNTEKSNVDLNAPKNVTNNDTPIELDTDEDIDERLKDTLTELGALEPVKLYNFVIDDNTNVIFKIISNDGEELVMKLITATGADKDKYLDNKNTTFTMGLTMDNIKKSPLGLGWFDILLTDNSGSESVLHFKDISDFMVHEPTGDEEEDDPEEDDEEAEYRSKDNMKDLLNRYPDFKKALYHQPKLLGLFNVGNPVGLAAVGGLINNYAAKEASEDFSEGNRVKIEIVSSRIFINVGAKPYNFDKGSTLTLDTTKRGDTTILTTSKTAKSKLEVEVLERIGDDNYNVKFTGISVKTNGKTSEVEKNGTIKVLSYD